MVLLWSLSLQIQDGVQLTLKSIMDSFDLALQSPQFEKISIKHLYQHISEGLFAHFFAISPYSKEDILCFMSLANKELAWENCLQDIPTKYTMTNCSCINFSNLKFTLDKILCKDEKDSDEDIAKPLKFYKSKVCKSVLYQNILDALDQGC